MVDSPGPPPKHVTAGTVIELRSVTVRYRDSVPLADLSVTLPHGSTAISGPSGSGKSTLLRVIAGLQPPDQGEVLIAGTPVRRPTWRTPSDSRVAVIHQDYRLVPFLTVQENLQLAAELRRSTATRERVADALRQVALDPCHADRLPGTLSGGQQQRVAIARAVIAGAEVILADEPTGSLDADNSNMIASLLALLGRSDGAAVVVATHDAAVAATMDHHLRLSEGALRAPQPSP